MHIFFIDMVIYVVFRPAEKSLKISDVRLVRGWGQVNSHDQSNWTCKKCMLTARRQPLLQLFKGPVGGLLQGKMSVHIQYTLILRSTLNFRTFLPNDLCYRTLILNVLFSGSRFEHATILFAKWQLKKTIQPNTLRIVILLTYFSKKQFTLTSVYYFLIMK